MGSDGTSDDLLIDPKDFESINLKISFHNETTQTAVKHGSRIYGHKKQAVDEDLSIRMVEIMDEGLGLEVPNASCAHGHKLKLNVEVEGVAKPFQFEAIGEVTDLERLERKRDRISVQFMKINDHVWLDFKKLYSKRQDQILDFFAAVKGM